MKITLNEDKAKEIDEQLTDNEWENWEKLFAPIAQQIFPTGEIILKIAE